MAPLKPTQSQRQRYEASLRRELEHYRETGADTLGIDDPDSYEIVSLPRQSERMSHLSPYRRERFRDHLLETIREALAAEAEMERIPPASDESATSRASEPDCTDIGDLPPGVPKWWELGGDPPELIEWLGNVCEACTGSCCSQGGDHAFLDVPTLRRFIRRNAVHDEEKILEIFMGRLPERNGGCVYQSEAGCALPRTDRASICNSFECPSLRKVRKQWTVDGPHRIFTIAHEQSYIQAAAFVEPGSVRRCKAPE